MIGTTVNVLRGLESGWNPGGGLFSTTRPPLEAALTETTPQPVAGRGNWDDLRVTLHDSPQHLLNTLFPCSVYASSEDSDAPSLYAGGMLLGLHDNTTAREDLGRTLGVPISEDYSYALAQFRRVDGQRFHNSRSSGIQESQVDLENNTDIASNRFKDDLRSLPRKKGLRMVDQMDQLTIADATAYLSFFKTWGTHFVSRVELGDVIMQVFAYKPENFKRIRNEFDENESNPQDFVQFTTVAGDSFGYVAHYGTLLNLSNDPSFSRSVSQNEWLDDLWAVNQNSIFKPFLRYSPVPTALFEYIFRNQTEIHTELSPLSVYCEFERSQLWRRILKAASATMFLDSIDPNLAPLDSRDFSRIFPDDQPGVISHLPTKNINVYKVRLDLGIMQLLERKVVDSFKACAYVVSTKGTDKVPGDNFQVIAGIIDARNEGKASILKLTDKAFESYELACNEFTGILRIENESGSEHDIIADGLSYRVSSDGYPEITKDIRLASEMANSDLSSQIRNFNFALTFGNAVLASQSQHEGDVAYPDIYSIVRNFLHWVGGIASPKGEKGGTSETEEMKEIRARALAMSLFYADVSTGKFVPILPPEDYEDEILAMMRTVETIDVEIKRISNQIAVRKSIEAQIEASADIKEEVQKSGKLLVGFVKSAAKTHSSISSSFSNVIKAQEREVEKEKQIEDRLTGELFKLKNKFNNAGQTLKQKIKQLQVIKVVEFIMEAGSKVFEAGTNIAIPAKTITDLARFGTSVQRIQKVFNVLQSAKGIYDSVAPEVTKITATLKVLTEMERDTFGDISVLPWETVDLEFKNIMAKLPKEATLAEAKADLELAFNTLVLKGKALMKTQSDIHQIQSKVYEYYKQKKLAATQEKDLQSLVTNFEAANINDFKIDEVDLVGMTSMLGFQRDQILNSLSQSFLLQDQGLQYRTLQSATLITSFSILRFLQARSDQKVKTGGAEAVLRGHQVVTTTPITYTVSNIPTTDLADGKDKRITIPPHASQFRQYAFVRVKSVTLSVEGVTSATSEGWSARLRFDDAPFVDRDMKGNLFTFRTRERERIYEFTSEGTPKFTDEGETWSEDQSRVTPFGGWVIDFSSATVFTGPDVTIHLNFVLETRIRAEELFFDVEAFKSVVTEAEAAQKPVQIEEGPPPSDISGPTLITKPPSSKSESVAPTGSISGSRPVLITQPSPSHVSGPTLITTGPASTHKPPTKSDSGPVLITQPSPSHVSGPTLITTGPASTHKPPTKSDSSSDSESDSSSSSGSDGKKKKEKKKKKKEKKEKKKKEKKEKKKSRSGSSSDSDSDGTKPKGMPEPTAIPASRIQFTPRIPIITQTAPPAPQLIRTEPLRDTSPRVEPSTALKTPTESSVEPIAVTQFSMLSEEVAAEQHSKEMIIESGHERTATNGWDVVFNMSAPFINTALEEQFNELQKDASFNNQITARPESQVGDSETITVSLTDVLYGAPTVLDSGGMAPEICLPLIQGFLVESKQWGSSPPITERTSLSSQTLKISVRMRRGDPVRFALGQGSFSFADLNPTEGDYRFPDGVRVAEKSMNLLFEEIKAFFNAHNITISLPLSLLSAEVWDINAMNAELEQQYNDIILKLSVANKIEATASETKAALTSMTEIQVTYSYPLIAFDRSGNEEATLSMKITSGSATKFIKRGDDAAWEQSGVTESLQDATLKAFIKLDKIVGTVTESDNRVLDVVLDMSKGTFRLSHVRLDLPSPAALSLSGTIKAHFAQNDVKFLINRVDLSEISVLPELTPSDFLTNLLVTPSKVEVLQLFIQTGGRALKNYTQTFLDNVPDPIPLGYECSIIVRSQLFFESILPASISNWSATGVAHGSPEQKRGWTCKFRNAVVVSQHIDLSELSRTKLFHWPTTGTRKFTYELNPPKITWNLGGSDSSALTLTPTSTGALTLGGVKDQVIGVQETSKDYYGWNERGLDVQRNTINITVQSDVAGTMRLHIDGDGRDQKVTSRMANNELNVNARTTGGGSCGCDDLEARVNKKVGEQLPPQIKSQLDIDVTPISAFAVKNLLFYKENYIDLKVAAAPGDLYIFGKIKTKPKTES